MKYFTIAEMERSRTALARGIDNKATGEAVIHLTDLIEKVLDPLREAWGRPITVNSGYRSPALNKAVGGVAGSQHQSGHAADITTGSRNGNLKLFNLICNLRLPYDQLIFEKGNLREGPDWIHISYDPKRDRRETIYNV